MFQITNWLLFGISFSLTSLDTDWEKLRVARDWGPQAATMVGTIDKPNITPLRRNAKYSLAEVDGGIWWIRHFISFHV